MACKNESCRARTFCEFKSDEIIDCQTCEEHRIITCWWHDKVSGLRDRDEVPFDDEEYDGPETEEI